MIYSIMDKKDEIQVKRARKIGGCVIVALTGFVKENTFYKITTENNQVVLTPLNF